MEAFKCEYVVTVDILHCFMEAVPAKTRVT